VLADGASGAGREGKVAMSRTCVELARSFDFRTSGLNPHDYISALFNRINDALIVLSQREGVLCFGTIVIALIENGELWTTTFGDSPAYLLKGGEMIRLAKNAKRYEWMINADHITREQYDSYLTSMHPMMWSAFDRFLPWIVPNNVIEHYTLSDSDVFFACSDGLSDWITPDSMLENIHRLGLHEAVDRMIITARDLALTQQNHYDDITAVGAVI
jgi:serine/threonine protein phosphatase PrpC